MKKLFGFTLIDILITVALIGILAAIAVPMYSEHVAKTRRRDAQSALLQFQNAMERYYTEQSPSTYTGAATGGTDTGFPEIFESEAPLHGETKFYNLQITDASTTTYELSASPKNGQADDRCGTMTVTNTGEKTAGDTNCW